MKKILLLNCVKILYLIFVLSVFSNFLFGVTIYSNYFDDAVNVAAQYDNYTGSHAWQQLSSTSGGPKQGAGKLGLLMSGTAQYPWIYSEPISTIGYYSIKISFLWNLENDVATRTNAFKAQWSTDTVNWFDIPQTAYTSTITSKTITDVPVGTDAEVANKSALYIKWVCYADWGSSTRDKVSFDNFRITGELPYSINISINSNIPTSYLIQGSMTNVILSFNLSNVSNNRKLAKISITNYGTATSSDISGVFLFKDLGIKGAKDINDVYIAELKYDSIKNQWTNNNISVTAATMCDYLIAVNISPSATLNNTIKAGINEFQVKTESSTASNFVKIVNANFQIIKNPGTHMITVAISSNIPGNIMEKGGANFTVLSVNISDSSNDTLDVFKIGNLGTCSNGRDIISVKLWEDVNNNKMYDSSDNFVTTLSWNGINYWSASNISYESNIKVTRNFVVTVDIATNAVTGRTFGAFIPVNGIRCDGGYYGPLSMITNKFKQRVGGIANHLVISEVAVGVGAASNEYVEIYNPTPNPITIDSGNFKLFLIDSSDKATKKTLTFNKNIVPAYGYFLLGAGSLPVTPDAIFSADLSKTSGVKITDGAGNKIDSVAWGAYLTNATESGPGQNVPNTLNTGDSIIRKANAFSTATSMTSGADKLKGNGFDTDDNSFDFIYLAGYQEPQNSSSPTEEPGDKIIITLTNVTTSTGYPTQEKTVMAFNLVNTTTSNITTIKITNLGTIQTNDLLNGLLNFYYDENKNGLYDTGETKISNVSQIGGKWILTNAGIKSGTNIVVTIKLDTDAHHNRTFKGCIKAGDVIGSDGTINKTAVTNPYSIFVNRVAPTISTAYATNNLGITTNGRCLVTNNGTNKWHLVANITENSNSGIVAFADLTAINSGIKFMTNRGGSIYSLSNLIVPTSVHLGLKNIIVLAYDATTNTSLVTKKTTQIYVVGNEPPVITNFSIEYTLIIKNSKTNYFAGTSKITQIKLVVSATDDTGIIVTNGIAKITNKGVTNIIKLSLISGATLNGLATNGTWQGFIKFTNSLRDISIGQHNIEINLFDNKGGIGLTNRFINFIQNDKPVANAGQDRTVPGGSIVQLDGSGSDTIGGIASYKWSIVSNKTGQPITLSKSNIANPTFKSPNVAGRIIFSLVVTDIYEDESAPSFVTVNINKTSIKDVSEVYPDNNPAGPDIKKITFNNIPANSKISIYTISGNKVDEIEVKEDSGTADWKIPDYLASGVYLVMIKGPNGDKKVLKIVIIR